MLDAVVVFVSACCCCYCCCCCCCFWCVLFVYCTHTAHCTLLLLLLSLVLLLLRFELTTPRVVVLIVIVAAARVDHSKKIVKKNQLNKSSECASVCACVLMNLCVYVWVCVFAHCSPQFARVLRVGKYKLCFGYSFSFSSSFRFRFLHCTSARRSDLDTTHTVFALSSLSSVQFSSAFWLQLLPLRCGTASASASDANANEQRAANESDDLRTALWAASCEPKPNCSWIWNFSRAPKPK